MNRLDRHTHTRRHGHVLYIHTHVTPFARSSKFQFFWRGLFCIYKKLSFFDSPGEEGEADVLRQALGNTLKKDSWKKKLVTEGQ